MARPVKGTVVIVPFPFSDLSRSKRRPAFVVANLSHRDLVLCQITSRIEKIRTRCRSTRQISLPEVCRSAASFAPAACSRPKRPSCYTPQGCFGRSPRSASSPRS